MLGIRAIYSRDFGTHVNGGEAMRKMMILKAEHCLKKNKLAQSTSECKTA